MDTVDLNLLSQIYPLGQEHGFDVIKQHVFQNVMGGMYSARDLVPRVVEIRVSGDAGWSEFHWTFFCDDAERCIVRDDAWR